VKVRRFDRPARPSVCPLCGMIVGADDPCGLLPYARTDDPRIVHARPAHWHCVTSPDHAALLEDAGLELGA